MDTLVSIRVFCLVAEMKSFAAAAGRLGGMIGVGAATTGGAVGFARGSGRALA